MTKIQLPLSSAVAFGVSVLFFRNTQTFFLKISQIPKGLKVSVTPSVTGMAALKHLFSLGAMEKAHPSRHLLHFHVACEKSKVWLAATPPQILAGGQGLRCRARVVPSHITGQKVPAECRRGVCLLYVKGEVRVAVSVPPAESRGLLSALLRPPEKAASCLCYFLSCPVHVKALRVLRAAPCTVAF